MARKRRRARRPAPRRIPQGRGASHAAPAAPRGGGDMSRGAVRKDAGISLRRLAACATKGRRRPGRLTVYLAASLGAHAVLLALLAHVDLAPARADRPRATRVRLVRLGAETLSGRAPEVSLPGARVVPIPPSEDLPPELMDPELLRRQMERMAALRADFFSPMTMLNAPMPVFPTAPDGPLPPLWGMPLPRIEGLEPLPPLPRDERQLAQALRRPGAPVSPPGGEPLRAPEAAAELLKEPLISLPTEVVTAADASAPAGEGIETADGVAMPGGVAGPGDAPAWEDGAIVSVPGEPASAPGDPGALSGPAIPAALEADLPPDGTGQDPAAPGDASVREPPEAGVQPGREGDPGVDPGAPVPAPEAVSEPEAPAPVPTVPEPAAPPPIVVSAVPPALRPDGLHAGLEGSYPAPVVAAVAGAADGGSLAALVAEVNERTRVRLAAGAASPDPFGGAPLVYLRGEGKVAFSAAERAALKRHVEGGGTLFVDGATGEFGESARAELSALFGAAPTPLATTHPLYHAFYRLADAPGMKVFPVQAIMVETRPAVVFSPAFLGLRWRDRSDPEREAAVAHGVNIVIHALAAHRPAPR
ncbi:MAG: DUF4159 domain-containing protein [Armatimonadetes bacterium]|nr:DUF4159 domain-containing protein [Armatimonadota bacterium]